MLHCEREISSNLFSRLCFVRESTKSENNTELDKNTVEQEKQQLGIKLKRLETKINSRSKRNLRVWKDG